MLNNSFHYHDGALWCDGVSLDAIAEDTGTPVYVYSMARLLENVRHLQSVFAPLGASIHYSLKANANLTIIRLLKEAGLGMDAVSAGEIFRALKAGVDRQRIVFAGVGKTRAELTHALKAGIGWFNVESPEELYTLNLLARQLSQSPVVALRLNPGIQAQTHPHIATGHLGAKFGMPAETVANILAHRKKFTNVFIGGIHIHIGSQLGSVDETVAAVRVAQEIAQPYPDVRTLNIGGGFPVPYTSGDDYPPLTDFATALQPLLDGWIVLIEPGRSIIADAGVMLVTVLYVKEQGGQRFVITNGSMTDLLRPALYDAVHQIVPVVRLTGDMQPTVVVGPVCESTDVLNRNAPLAELTSGARLAVMNAGAYGIVMASNYNMRTRPPEVLVQGDTWRLIRRRETWDDLLRLEDV